MVVPPLTLKKRPPFSGEGDKNRCTTSIRHKNALMRAVTGAPAAAYLKKLSVPDSGMYSFRTPHFLAPPGSSLKRTARNYLFPSSSETIIPRAGIKSQGNIWLTEWKYGHYLHFKEILLQNEPVLTYNKQNNTSYCMREGILCAPARKRKNGLP